MNKFSKIYIAGHTGLIGSALLRRLQSLGYKNLLLPKNLCDNPEVLILSNLI
jgi:nucleoside-diphosphate-sugar epimerase